MLKEAGLVLVGHSSLKAALDRDWGQPQARAQALHVGLAEVERWTDNVAGAAPASGGECTPPAGRSGHDHQEVGHAGRRTRPGRWSWGPGRASPFRDTDIQHGGQAQPTKRATAFRNISCWTSIVQVTCEVVVRPANEPEHAAVELLVETLEKPPGLRQRDIDLGYMASPHMTQWAEQGVYVFVHPWPQGGTRFTPDDFAFDSSTGMSRVRAARLCQWSQAKLPNSPPALVVGVHSARSVPQPSSAEGGTCRSGKTKRTSARSAPRSKPSAR